MPEFLNSPPVLLFLAPALAVFFFAGILLFLGRGGTGPRIAGAALGVAAAWIATLHLGFPGFPPLEADDAFAYIAVIGLVLGVILDLNAERRRKLVKLAEPFIIILYALGAIAWVRAGIDPWAVLYLLAWGLLTFRLQSVSARDGRLSAVMVIMIAIGVGLTSWIAGLTAERNIALSIGGAAIGLLLWTWATPRIRFSTAAVLAAGAVLMLLTIRLLDPMPAFVPALALTGFVLWADHVAERIPVRPDFMRSSIQPFLLAGVSLLPVLLAAAAAFVASRFPAG